MNLNPENYDHDRCQQPEKSRGRSRNRRTWQPVHSQNFQPRIGRESTNTNNFLTKNVSTYNNQQNGSNSINFQEPKQNRRAQNNSYRKAYHVNPENKNQHDPNQNSRNQHRFRKQIYTPTEEETSYQEKNEGANHKLNILPSNSGVITKGKLQTLLKGSPSDIVIGLIEFSDDLMTTLKQPSLETEIVTSILEVLAKGVSCQMYQENVHQLMEMLLESRNFLQHLEIHATMMLTADIDLNKTFSDLVIIFQLITSRMPHLASNDLHTSIMLYSSMMQITNDSDCQLKSETLDKMKRIREQTEKLLTQKIKSEQTNTDETQQLDNLPKNLKTEEIIYDEKQFLIDNAIEAENKKVKHYTNEHYRFLRENYLASIRADICEYLKLDAKIRNIWRYQNVQFYHRIRIIRQVLDQYHIQFDIQPFRRIDWEKSRRLLFGSLLCLSPDNFETLIFATIVNREVKSLKKGIVTIKLEKEINSPLVIKKFVVDSLYVMAESPVNFEEYSTIVHSLKSINPDTMPFQDYLIEDCKKHRLPNYLEKTSPRVLPCELDTSNTVLDVEQDDAFDDYYFGCNDHVLCEPIERLGSPVHVPETMELISWSSARMLELDESQRSALHLALTSSMAVIQGPPGTGKTFVGLEIVDSLLANAKVDNHPVLVVCLTTHALDRFLEGVLEITQSVVRVGGQSKNRERLGPFDLKNKMDENRKRDSCLATEKFHDLSKKLAVLKAKINGAENLLDRWDSIILHEQQLTYLPDEEKITVEKLLGTSSKSLEKDSCLQSWLGILLDNKIKECEVQNFCCVLTEQTEIPVAPVIKDVKDMENAADEDDTLIHDDEDDTLIHDDNKSETDFNPNESTTDSQQVFDNGVLNVDKIKDPNFMLNNKKHRKNISKSKGVDEIKNCSEDINVISNCKDFEKKCILRYHIANRELAKKDLMDDSEVARLHSWNIPLSDRWRLYRRWRNAYHKVLQESIDKWRKQYTQKYKLQQMYVTQEEYKILQQCKVIGMTITGAAKYQSILHEIGCKIIVVEEAANIPESHIIAAVNPATEHLILIGDHQQLRPKLKDDCLGKQSKLGISLFERLITNELPCATLEEQHRMRPEISQIIRQHNYPHLIDHLSVSHYPSVLGMEQNIFFLNHCHAVRMNSVLFEAQFLVALCRYLIRQGYSPSQITILTMHARQVHIIKKLVRDETIEGVSVTFVDNYEGYENDIILLSFFTKIEECDVEVLNLENQSNVAYSRARLGLYAVGNFDLLAQRSLFWKNLTDNLKYKNFLGPSMSISCQNHPEKRYVITSPEDFQQHAREGGCSEKCQKKLPCGHICKRVCHVTAHEPCKEPCQKTCALQHPCPLLCHQGCNPCLVNINKKMECGHTAMVACSLNVNEYKCPVIMERKFSDCPHKLKRECHKSAEILQLQRCPEDCHFRLECGHKCTLKCHPQYNKEHMGIKCEKPCERKVCTLSHEAEKCKNLCFEKCSSCAVIEKKNLSCNHVVSVKCGETAVCPEECERILSCGHKCKDKCCDPCGNCNEMIDMLSPCSHSFKIECHLRKFSFMEYDTDPKIYALVNKDKPVAYSLNMRDVPLAKHYTCEKPCRQLLPCGHECQELCKEKCTTTCKATVTMKGLCGHDLPVFCHRTTLNEEALQINCRQPCRSTLSCGHQCRGSCGMCRRGRLHLPCKNKCDRMLTCGHYCDRPCAEICPPCNRKCPMQCEHNQCRGTCGDPCNQCTEKCEWVCWHYQCPRRCGEYCDRPRCNEPCDQRLRCGHSCLGLCGELCPPLCRLCRPSQIVDFMFLGTKQNKNSRYIELLDCGHSFEVDGLDQWMDSNSNNNEVKKCPRCNIPIRKSYRYANVIRKCLENVQTEKRRIPRPHFNPRERMATLLSSLYQHTSIQRIFKENYEFLQTRLSQKVPLHYNDCNIIENQIDLLSKMSTALPRQKIWPQSVQYLKFCLGNLARRLRSDEPNTELQHQHIHSEIRRIVLVASVIKVEEQFQQRGFTAVEITNLVGMKTINTKLRSGSRLTRGDEDHLQRQIQKIMAQ